MKLLVELPLGYEQERRWIVDVLLGSFLGLEHEVLPSSRPDVRVSREGRRDGRALTMPDLLFRTPVEKWLTRDALPPEPFPRWCVSSDLPELRVEDLPIFYRRSERSTGLVVDSPEGVTVDIDIFGAAFIMLTRYEECLPGPRDAHGRMPSTASIARREGFLDRPIVNEYLDILFALMSRIWPDLQRKEWSYYVRPTHDVDFPLVTHGRGPRALVRRVAGDVVLRHSVELALRTARASGSRGTRRYRLDPGYTFDFIMATSEEHGLQSSFYFICGRTDPAVDGDYELDDPWIASLMRRVHERGHALGLHPSYRTCGDPPQIAREYQALRQAADRMGIHQERWGGRQHYLRWENPVTWRAWNDAGLDYDCTLGFADHVGFRCGVCYPFPAFDLLESRTLNLVERPMQVMDTTLTEYMGLSNEKSIEWADRLAGATRRHGGEFQLLWHNTGLLTRAQQRHYSHLIEVVTQ